MNSVPTGGGEGGSIGMNGDGICIQPVSSSRQERTTPSQLKPQIVQPICFNAPQEVT